MGKLIGCAGLLFFLIGFVLLLLANGYYERPGLAMGTLAPLPRDWGKIWGTAIAGGAFVLLPVAFMIWGAISTRRNHPGLTLTEAIKAEEAADAELSAKRLGYIDVKPTQHSCSPPMFTGPRAKFAVGLGSIWECPVCQKHWRLQAHEVATGMRGKSGSTWGFVLNSE